MTNLERKKETVFNFYDLYDLAFNQTRPQEPIARSTGDQFIQYSPGVRCGKEGFIEYFAEIGRRSPGKRVHFKKPIIAEAHDVARHCLQEWPRKSPLDRHRYLPPRRRWQNRGAL